MGRRIVSINKKMYEQVKTLVSEGHDYIIWKEKSKKPFGSQNYMPDHVNLYLRDVPTNKMTTPQLFAKTINLEFRCFIVPINFASSDPKASLRYMKLNITGVGEPQNGETLETNI